MKLIYVRPGASAGFLPTEAHGRINALESLGHVVKIWPHSPHSLVGHTDDAVVVVDSTGDSDIAKRYCHDLSLLEAGLPILAIVSAQTAREMSRGWEVDDFILDTSTPVEVLIRITRMIRAAKASRSTAYLHRCGPLTLDDDRLTLSVGPSNSVGLTRTEHAVLLVFFTNPDVVVSRHFLLARAWNGRELVSTRTIDAFISRIRRRFGPLGVRISTVRGVGYRLSTTSVDGSERHLEYRRAS